MKAIISILPRSALFATAATLLACAGPSAAGHDSRPAQVVARVPANAAPDTPAGRQLTWVLTALDHSISDSDIAPHFARSFLEQIPAAKVSELLTRLRADAAPFTVDQVERQPNPQELVAIVHGVKGPRLRVSLVVEGAEEGRVTGLLIKQAD